MKFKSAIFDLDGTLLDTIIDLSNSMNAVLKKHGYMLHDYKSYKIFIGKGIKNLVKKALPSENINNEKLNKYLSEMEDEYSKRCFENTIPYPGIIELLNHMQNSSITISVYSNKADNFTKKMVKKYFPSINYAFIIGARENFKLKPDPSVPKEISESLGIKPEDFMYIGDSEIDMQTAVNSGMFPVGALWGYRNEKELVDNGAKLLLKNPMDLIDFIEKN